MSEELDSKAFGLEFVKRPFGISNGIQRIKDWTLWKGRPSPRLKNLHAEEEPVM
jgi:hypothetical protein